MIYMMLLVFSLLTSNVVLILGLYLFYKKGKNTSSMALFGFGFTGILVSVGLLVHYYSNFKYV